MERVDIDTSDKEVIKELLESNPIGRNKYLETMINFLVNIEGQLVLNLDGEWGTGKTIFLKELEYLNDKSNDTGKLINAETISRFQNKYEVFYYNSWENDIYTEPLETLIYQLMMKMAEVDSMENKIEERLNVFNEGLKKAGLLVGNIAISKVTGGIVSLENLKTDEDNHTKSIIPTEERKKSVFKIIDTLIESTGKKILILIDELDRCKPSYSINLLEVIKHFFSHKDIVFLFASNKSELVNTVKQSYGQEFDGHRYLNRFFDFEFTLPNVTADTYFNYKYGNRFNQSFYTTKVIVSLSEHFNFSMRDMDRYASLCITLLNFWNNSINRYYTNRFIENFMIPYAIALKIHNGQAYKEFIEGKGLEAFILFCRENGELTNRYLNLNGHDTTETIVIEEVTNIYSQISIANNSSSENKMDEKDYYSFQRLFEILTMMSDIATN